MNRANRKVPVNAHLYLCSKIGSFYIRNYVLYRLAELLIDFFAAGEQVYIFLIGPDVIRCGDIDFINRNL
jgi:hypothetical protein